MSLSRSGRFAASLGQGCHTLQTSMPIRPWIRGVQFCFSTPSPHHPTNSQNKPRPLRYYRRRQHQRSVHRPCSEHRSTETRNGHKIAPSYLHKPNFSQAVQRRRISALWSCRNSARQVLGCSPQLCQQLRVHRSGRCISHESGSTSFLISSNGFAYITGGQSQLAIVTEFNG